MLNNKRKYIVLSFLTVFVTISASISRGNLAPEVEEKTFRFTSIAGELPSEEVGSDIRLKFMGLERLIPKDELSRLEVNESADYRVFGKGDILPPDYRYQSPCIHLMKLESDEANTLSFQVRLKFEFKEMISPVFAEDCISIFNENPIIKFDKYAEIMECLGWFIRNEEAIKRSKDYIMSEPDCLHLIHITNIVSMNLHKRSMRKDSQLEMEITLNKLKIFEKELLDQFDKNSPKYQTYVEAKDRLFSKIPAEFRYRELESCTIEELQHNVRNLEYQLETLRKSDNFMVLNRKI